MRKEEEFIAQLEGIVRKSIGGIVGGSLYKQNVAKLGKDISAISPDDCKALTQNILKSSSAFLTAEEVAAVSSELNNLFNTYFG